MITFSDVTLKYTKEFCALNKVSFNISSGDVVALYGGKDSGKSCILRLIAGLEKPTSGEVYIGTTDVKDINFQTDFSLGYIPYKGSFFEDKTVYDNLKYILKVRGVNEAEQENLINKSLIDFKLESIKDEKVKNLPLFTKYVLSIVRLTYRKLDLLLVDNIFEELSEAENKKIFSLIKKYFIKNTSAIIYATSDEETSKLISTKVIKLEQGVVLD